MEGAHGIFGMLTCPERTCIVACMEGEGRDQTSYCVNNCLTIIRMKAAKENLGSCKSEKRETFLVVWDGFPREKFFEPSPGGREGGPQLSLRDITSDSTLKELTVQLERGEM